VSVWFLSFAALSLGTVWGWGLERLVARERAFLGLAQTRPEVRSWRAGLVGIAVAGLSVALNFAELELHCLETPEVQPPDWAWQTRVIYHALLAGLLIGATVIDLDCYVIPDQITAPGILCGIVFAAVAGDMQIAHLWVDWSYAIPQLRGPYIPEWYHDHHVVHALAWSIAGAVAGMVLTLLVRALSSRVIGQEAMGLGDVALMTLIGSFLGWQAVVLTFAVAPLTGLLVALIGKLIFNRPYLPYGPCLSAAALVVIFTWRWLWALTRLMFSDLVGLAILAAIGAVALTLLLGLLRLYRNIPTGR